MKIPKCNDTRECFAKVDDKGERCCSILSRTYDLDGQCRFCKAKRGTKKNVRNKKQN